MVEAFEDKSIAPFFESLPEAFTATLLLFCDTLLVSLV
jgi:hypothetical protein